MRRELSTIHFTFASLVLFAPNRGFLNSCFWSLGVGFGWFLVRVLAVRAICITYAGFQYFLTINNSVQSMFRHGASLNDRPLWLTKPKLEKPIIKNISQCRGGIQCVLEKTIFRCFCDEISNSRILKFLIYSRMHCTGVTLINSSSLLRTGRRPTEMLVRPFPGAN